MSRASFSLTGASSSREDKAKEILRARARVLAKPAESQRAAAAIEVVEFKLANERYALEQGQVKEIHPLKDLTPLPCVPAFMRGITNVRGRIIPVIDLKRFFGLTDTGITDIHVVIVVQAGDVEVGILADGVNGVRSIAVDAFQSSLPTLTGIRAQYLRGVTDDQMTILDVGKMLGDPKIIINDEAPD